MGSWTKLSKRIGLSLGSFLMYYGIPKGEMGMSSLHSQGIVISGGKYFFLRFVQTACLWTGIFAETWGWYDIEADKAYRRTRAPLDLGDSGRAGGTAESAGSAAAAGGVSLVGEDTGTVTVAAVGN